MAGWPCHNGGKFTSWVNGQWLFNKHLLIILCAGCSDSNRPQARLSTPSLVPVVAHQPVSGIPCVKALDRSQTDVSSVPALYDFQQVAGFLRASTFSHGKRSDAAALLLTHGCSEEQ